MSSLQRDWHLQVSGPKHIPFASLREGQETPHSLPRGNPICLGFWGVGQWQPY